jgi:hypothetical protein
MATRSRRGRIVPPRCAHRKVAALVALAGLGLAPLPAHAQVQGAVGYDQSFGPGDQYAQAAVAVVAIGGSRASLYLAPSRYDHSVMGGGYGFGLGGSTVVSDRIVLTAGATRFMGDDDHRGWRVKLGPTWSGLDGQRVGLFYTHDEGSGVAPADGMAAEASTPLAHNIRGMASSAWADRDGMIEIAAGVGAIWSVVPALQLSAFAGMAHEGTASGTSGPGPLGGESGGAAQRKLLPTGGLSLRILFPTSSE